MRDNFDNAPRVHRNYRRLLHGCRIPPRCFCCYSILWGQMEQVDGGDDDNHYFDDVAVSTLSRGNSCSRIQCCWCWWRRWRCNYWCCCFPNPKPRIHHCCHRSKERNFSVVSHDPRARLLVWIRMSWINYSVASVLLQPFFAVIVMVRLVFRVLFCGNAVRYPLSHVQVSVGS
jgi:hypothetical protein